MLGMCKSPSKRCAGKCLPAAAQPKPSQHAEGHGQGGGLPQSQSCQSLAAFESSVRRLHVTLRCCAAISAWLKAHETESKKQSQVDQYWGHISEVQPVVYGPKGLLASWTIQRCPFTARAMQLFCHLTRQKALHLPAARPFSSDQASSSRRKGSELLV